MEHACFFIGQRTAGEEVYPALAEAVERHITGYGVRRFYVGRYGNFDRMAARAVGEAKARHSGVELVLVLPYHPAQHPVPVPPGFDRSLYPWEGERVPPRLAILRTDQRMVERCAFLIACARPHLGGSGQVLDFVQRRAARGLLRVEELDPAGI